MDKLISAKSLYKKLSTNYKGERIPEYDVDNFPVTLTLKQIKKVIRDEPAAFDKEKVTEEIAGIMNDESIRFAEQAVNRSIEIVEKGGIE